MLFLFRKKADAKPEYVEVAYIKEQPIEFQCGHYWSGISLCGPTFYSNSEWPKYEDIETILTKGEYLALMTINKKLKELKYGIKQDKNDPRYKEGLVLKKAAQKIIDKLSSEENQDFFEKIWEEEKNNLMDEYSLSEDDIENILGQYREGYKDSSIISCIYKDAEEFGYEEANSCGFISSYGNQANPLEKYIDFEKFGEDVIDEHSDQYIQLEDGRVVCMNV